MAGFEDDETQEEPVDVDEIRRARDILREFVALGSAPNPVGQL